MFKEHHLFRAPENPNTEIWRYLDFTKFVSLLDRKALFFIRGDKLSDKFEGSLPKKSIKKRAQALEILPDKERAIMLRTMPKVFQQIRENIFINCWSKGVFESAAMWNIYLKSDEGVAIQSTYKKLKESFSKCTTHDVLIGEVKYIDYENEYFPSDNMFYPFLHKRKSFEHEQEIRAIIFIIKGGVFESNENSEIKKYETGIYVPIDIDILIENIFVSPKAEPWFRELVESVIKNYHINKNVRQSSLTDDPLF
jgi:hypothetical protein